MAFREKKKLVAEPVREGGIHRERPSSCQSRGLTCLFSQGGDLPSVEEAEVPAPPLLLQWVKTDQALLMLFSDGTVQVRAYPVLWWKVWYPRVLGRNVDLVSKS